MSFFKKITFFLVSIIFILSLFFVGKILAQSNINLRGWAWFSNFGWVSLSALNHFGSPPADCSGQNNSAYGLILKPDRSLCGWAYSSNFGWVCFGSSCLGLPQEFGATIPPGGWQAQVIEESGNFVVYGWAKALFLGDEGWLSLNCKNDEFFSIGSSHCFQSNYKTLYDSTVPTLAGFSWNNNDNNRGAGWLGFNPEVYDQPWLETKFGDIYAKGGISAVKPPPLGYANATYQILANGNIINFSSLQCPDLPCNWIDPNFGPIDFPSPTNRYTNILGRLDLDGLITKVNGNLNKYGQEIVDIDQAIDIGFPNGILGGKIYYHLGDLDINVALEFRSGSAYNSNDSGAGTVIVNGDLNIYADVDYNNQFVIQRLINLASLAWIVKGNIYISSEVEKLAGAFVSLGAEGCSDPSCGVINTGAFTSPDKPLEVSGLMIARQFYFQRQYLSALRGAERIIYDGRILANIPPGLEDFAGALPIWREGIFTP